MRAHPLTFRRTVCTTLLALVSLTAPTRAHAQLPLAVQSHSPLTTVRPTGPITITFDRPVVGTLEHTFDPSRYVRIEPSLRARVEWRDPSTIRILPIDAMVPGTRYSIVVDTGFDAIDGSRLPAPQRIELQVLGPTVMGSMPRVSSSFTSTLEPTGRITVAFSAPVADSVLARAVRLTLRGTGLCTGVETIGYHVARQRAGGTHDDYYLVGSASFTSDTIAERNRRIVEFLPDKSLPEGCDADLTIISFDSLDAPTIRYRITTAAPFELKGLSCWSECFPPNGVVVHFSAPVAPDALLAAVKFSPAGAFHPTLPKSPVTDWVVAGTLAPRGSYAVTVDTSLRDTYGRRIGGRIDRTLELGDSPVELGYATGMVYLPTKPVPTLRFRHINVDSVKLLLMPVPDSERVRLVRLARRDGARALYALRDTIVRLVAVHAPRNETGETEIALPELQTRYRGQMMIVQAVVQRSSLDSAARNRPTGTVRPIVIVGGEPSRSARTVLQSTDLIAHAKLGANGAYVRVTSARSGLPIAGARVSMLDTAGLVQATSTTDARGIAELRQAREAGFVDVQSGRDRSLIELPMRARAESLPSAERLIDGEELTEARNLHALVFTDRGIYRPADPIYVSAVVREGMIGNFNATLAKDSVRLAIEREDEAGDRAVIADTVIHASSLGSVHHTFTVRAGAEPGRLLITASLFRRGTWRRAGETGVRVSEYRAPEFLVDAHTDSALHFRGDTIAVGVGAKYLFGAPMAGAIVDWNASVRELSEWELRVPGLGREWTAGAAGGWWEAEGRGESYGVGGHDTLDASGTGRLKVRTDSVPAGRPSRVIIDVAVIDLNRQVVTATALATVHPASFYLAMRDSSSFWWGANASHRVALLAVRPDGRRVAGVRTRLAVVRRSWVGGSGDAFGSSAGSWRADTLRIDSLTTTDSAVVYTVPPITEGAVDLIATAIDEQSRPVRSSIGRWVFGRGPIAGSSPIRLAVKLQRDHVKPGDDLVATFTSPWDAADAWVTIEREGVLAQRVLRNVRGTVTVRLPVTREAVPNGFVAVYLSRRGAIATGDSASRHLRMGYAAFRVDDASKRLDVAIIPRRRDYAPGDSATIDVRLRDWRGRGATGEVTLWATDEGVLAMTGFRTPDPLKALAPLTRNGVAQSSTLLMLPVGTPPWLWRAAQRRAFDGTNMLNAFALSSSALSAVVSDGLGNSRSPSDTLPPRSDFRATAFFRAGIRTDTNGVARVTVKLPDNITTFRLMAVAISDREEYGHAEQPMLVTKPLVVRAALPRVVRNGDSLYAGAVLNARDAGRPTVDVAASGSGISLLGASRKTATLDSRGAEVRFAWRGTETDSARIMIRASDATNADAVRVAIPVAADRAPQARTIAGMVRDSTTVRIALPRDFDPAKSTIAVRSGSSPVPTLLAARDFLRNWRYSCSSVLASRGRLLVSLLEAQRNGVVVVQDTTASRRELQALIDELSRRAKGSVVDCWSFSWILPELRYDAELLVLDARDIGLTVDTTMVQQWTDRYRKELDSAPVFADTLYGSRAERNMQIANHLKHRLGAVAFQHRVGPLRDGDIQPLVQYANRLTWEDRAWLAELLEQTNHHAEAQRLLARLWLALPDAGNRVEVPDSVLQSVGIPSHVRPPARLLRATLAIAPEDPRIGKLVERLTVRTRAERDTWWNAEDHVAAAAALARFARGRRDVDAPVVVRTIGNLGGRGTTFTATSGATEALAVSLAGVVTAGDSMELLVSLSSAGGPQYYSITLNEVTRERPTAPQIRGMTVERWYERFDDGRTVTEVREGELVRVRLKVTVPADREFVALEDVLPAGLEAVDLTLKTSSTLGPFAASVNEITLRQREREALADGDGGLFGSWYGGWWSPWSSARQYDERTVFFARKLWRGASVVSYVVRATTAGRFVRPQAHAEESYNPALSGRSEGGWFVVGVGGGKP